MAVRGAASKTSPTATGAPLGPPSTTASPVSQAALRNTLAGTNASLRQSALLVGRVLAQPGLLQSVIEPHALLGHIERLLSTASELLGFAARWLPEEQKGPEELRTLRREMHRMEQLRQALERRLDSEEERALQTRKETRRRETDRKQERIERDTRTLREREERGVGAPGNGRLQRRA